MLAGSTFVMLGLGQNAQAPQLLIQVLHEGGYAGTDGAEVVVIQFLTLGRLRAEERTAGQPQVFTLGIKILGQQEVFLFCADGRYDPNRFFVTK